MPASVSAMAIAMKNSGTQSPSLSPLSTLSPWRIRDGTRSSETTAWPSAASVQASTIASTSASAKLTPGHDRRADQRPGDDRQRQADPEQAQRHRVLAAQRAQRDPRRVGEQHERQRDLGEQLDLLAVRRAGPADPSTGPTSSPAVVKNIAPDTFSRSSRRETAA